MMHAPLPVMTPEQAAQWLAILEEEAARRGPPPMPEPLAQEGAR